MKKKSTKDGTAASEGIDFDLMLAFVDTLIPGRVGPDAMPAASELPEFCELSSGEAQGLYGPALELIVAQGGAGGGKVFQSLELDGREGIVRKIESEHPSVIGGAVGQTLIRYYGSDRVVQALGLDVGPSHPRGYGIDETNWTLLDPIKKMDRIYKTA